MSTQKDRPLLNLTLNILLPSIILVKFSSPGLLGAFWGLITALSFPLSYGLFEMIRYRKINAFSLIGLVSILLTGTFGLLSLDAKWITMKEGGVPFVLGILILVSMKTPYPAVGRILFNDKIFNTQLVYARLNERGMEKKFRNRIFKATFMLASSFFLSSILNIILARTLLKSPPGTAAFNAELGRMTAYSFPVIAVPSMIVMAVTLFYLCRSITALTELGFEEMLNESLHK